MDTSLNLFEYFTQLMEEQGWDGELIGDDWLVRFDTANRNHLEEFKATCFLLNLTEQTNIFNINPCEWAAMYHK